MFSLPSQLFDSDYSRILNDNNGNLLGAQVASDGQWRFPKIDSVPQNFEMAILCFEDKRFYDHIGIDFLAIARALKQNIKHKKIISGASTVTMQVARMSQKNKPRTYFQKLKEIILATRIEWSYSKEEILELYTSHAPFGGNVVGLEAASWRYFGKSPDKLSIAEAAMLAVLPNAPSLIHISKNRDQLLQKRNDLLAVMKASEIISSDIYQLSILEELPNKPFPLPREAHHLLYSSFSKQTAEKKFSTLDFSIQSISNDIANEYHHSYSQNDIQNMAILVVETKTGKVLSYVGNPLDATQEKDVDLIHAPRSSGSVLKPLLYAHSLDKSLLLPKMLVRDVPTIINGFQPKNYNRKYTGAVSADEALAMSLNIPAVIELQNYGVNPFLNRLKDHGFSTFNKDADHYGLSLILGGGEVTLWELVQSYARLGFILNTYNTTQKYPDSKAYALKSKQEIRSNKKETLHHSHDLISAGSIYSTFLAMKEVQRPGDDGHWRRFNSSKDIAWKTGTSHGHKDAWAVGVTPEYTIGVWVGNADGEGKNGLVGYKAAAPVMFDIFNKLPNTTSFEEPVDDLIYASTCRNSGFLATMHCEVIDTLLIPLTASNALPCPYHVFIHTDNTGKRVHSGCASPNEMDRKKWFVLPSSMANFYRVNHPEYKTLPNYHENCNTSSNTEVLSFIYPSHAVELFIPKNRIGEKTKTVFSAAHINPEAKLFWHLDENYLGVTTENHAMSFSISEGQHIVKIIDEDGNQKSQKFSVIN